MKKILTLVLAVCLLMSAAALAEESPFLQNEMPPELVTTPNSLGEMIGARLCDAQGSVLLEVKDDGSLILTDVHQREAAENETVADRLTNAYNDVMDDVHHADVECDLHDHDAKVDVDAILASIDPSMDSHDLVMFEFFDVMTSGEIAALLTDGSYLELTFELEEGQSLPLITMFTNDGVDWHVIPTTPVSERRFTVRLSEPGTLALLNDGRESMGVGQDGRHVITVIPGEEGDEIIESRNFTPSVSGKSAPQIVTIPGTEDEIYVGYIRNRAGDMEIPVPDKNYIIITAVSERNYTGDIQTHEHLEWAYDDILEVEDVGDLFTEHDLSVVIPDHEHGTIAGLLDEELARRGLDLTHDRLVVKDLFEVSAYGDYLHPLYDEENYLEVTFEANLDPDKPLVVIHSMDSVHWHVHPAEDAVIHSDGTVTLRMYDLGVVAFLVESEEEVDAETAVQSPN